MADELRARLIVEAIAKGFPALTKNLKLVGMAVQDVSKGTKGWISLTKAGKALDQQAMSLARMTARMTEVSKGHTAQLAREEQKTRELTQARLAMGAALVGAAAVSAKFLGGTIALSARVETLGVVTATLGKNIGMTETEVRSLEEAIQSKGITLQAARSSIALMIQAEIDLSKATDMARLAQDAAVIANVNSSESFERLTYVISSGNVRMARRMGLMVDFQAAYLRESAALGKNTAQLTAYEKVQIRTNEVLRAGEHITGAYSAAMETAGKKATSLARFIEGAETAVGEVFLPTYAALLDILMDSLQAWTDLENVTQRQVAASVGVATAWTGLLGVAYLLMAALPKLKFALFAVQYAMTTALGPIGILIAAIAGASLLYVRHAAQTRYVAETLRELTREAVDTGKSYAQFREEVAKLADEQDRLIMTQEEHNALTQDATAYIQEQQKAGVPLAKIMGDIADAQIVVNESTYNLDLAWGKLKSTGLELATTQDLVEVGMGEVAKRLESLDDGSMVAARSQEYLALQSVKVREELDNLAILISGPVKQAFEDYASGSEDAIQKVLYNLIETSEALEGFEDFPDYVRAIGEEFGLLDPRTESAKEKLALFIELAAKGGSEAQFAARVAGYALVLERTAEAAAKANENIGDLIVASSDKSFSPMAKWREDIEWFMAGGGEIKLAFEEVMAAMTAKAITPVQAHTMLAELMAVEIDLEVEIGHKSLEEGTKAIADALGWGIDEARAYLLSTEGISGALEQIGKIKTPITLVSNIKAEIEAAKLAYDDLKKYGADLATQPLVAITGGWIDENAITAAETQIVNLETALHNVAGPTAQWTLPFNYTDMVDAYDKMTESEALISALDRRRDNLHLDYSPIQKAVDEATRLETRLNRISSTTYYTQIYTTTQPYGTGSSTSWAGGVEDFVVPPGHYEPQRPYMIGVSSGETVSVARAGEKATASGGGDIHIYNDITNLVDIEEITSQVIQAIAGV